MVILKAMQHRVPQQLEFDTLEEAMRHAWADVEWNNAYPEEIVDGDKVYIWEDMQKYWDEKGWND